jgi:hypothetical protein
VNGFDRIYIERVGKLEFIPNLSFKDNQHLMQIIDRIVFASPPRLNVAWTKICERSDQTNRVGYPSLMARTFAGNVPGGEIPQR